jgi:hypothetical protein
MRKVAITLSLVALSALAACQKSGDGGVIVEKPVVGTQTDTLHPPTVDVGTQLDTISTPVVGMQKDTIIVNKPVVGTQRTEVKTPTVNVKKH